MIDESAVCSQCGMPKKNCLCKITCGTLKDGLPPEGIFGDKIIPKKFTPAELKLLAEDEMNAVDIFCTKCFQPTLPEYNAALEKAVERLDAEGIGGGFYAIGFKDGFRAGFDVGRADK